MIKNKLIKSWIKKRKYRVFFIVFLTLINTLILTLLPILLSAFLDILILPGLEKKIMNIIIAYIFLNISSILISYTIEKLCVISSWDLIRDIRKKVIGYFMQTKVSYLTDHTDGEILEVIEEDINNLQQFTSIFINIISNFLLILLTIIVYFMIFPLLGIIEILFVFISLLLLYKNKQKGQKVQEESRNYSSKFFSFMSEIFHNYVDLTLVDSYNFVINKLINIAKNWLPISIKSNVMVWSAFILIQILQLAGSAITFIVGVNLWINKIISVGTIFLMYNYTKNILEPISNLQNQIQVLQIVSASFQKIEEIFKIPIERSSGNIINTNLIDSVVMNRVSFSYNSDQLIIDNSNLKILKGKSIAIIGKTGIGKSTIGNILTGLYEVKSGDIFLGKTSIHDVSLKELRKLILYVPQENFIFDTSLKNNITLYNDEITEDIILNAINTLNLEKWFQYFNNDLNIKIDDKFDSLGYLKVISILRSFISDSEIIIFDEITAGLDINIKEDIINCLKILKNKKTLILITHDNELLSIVNEIYTFKSKKLELLTNYR